MMKINKNNLPVVVKYSNGKIKLYNEDRSVGAVLEITSSELRKMYVGDEGEGILHIQITEDETEV